jgi:para-nitrobenzyl esterase
MFRIDHAPRITRLFGLGATHGSDVALLFGALDGPGRLLGGTRADQAFVGHLSADLISFARAGVPRSLWPEYERTRRATLVYTTTTAVVDDPDRERREAWTGFVGYR